MLKAMVAGLVIAVVFLEATTAGMAAVLPSGAVHVEAIPGWSGSPPWPLWPAPALAWLLSAAAGGAMATAVAGRQICGLAVGCLLALPALAIVGWVTPGNPMMLLGAMIPITGAAAGTLFAERIRHEDAAASVHGQAV